MFAALRRDSAVERRLLRLAPRLRTETRWRPVSGLDLRQSGIALSQTGLVAAKLLAAIAGAALGVTAGLFTPLGPIAIVAGAYTGFVLPSLIVERRARARRLDAERSLGTLVEWLEALAAAGRPVETALASLAERPTGASLLDGSLGRAARAYALGAPLFRALATDARVGRLDGLASLAAELDRSRDLGRGSLNVIRDAREGMRATERARSLEAAAQVEGKLMLVLVLCYLPALLLLVVIPLFIGLLNGLFG